LLDEVLMLGVVLMLDVGFMFLLNEVLNFSKEAFLLMAGDLLTNGFGFGIPPSFSSFSRKNLRLAKNSSLPKLLFSYFGSYSIAISFLYFFDFF